MQSASNPNPQASSAHNKHVEPISTEDLAQYSSYLARLKAFQDKAFPDQNNILDYFERAYVHYEALQAAHYRGKWSDAVENVDRRLLKHSLELMRQLTILKLNATEQKDNAMVYPMAIDLWRKSAILAQEVLKNSRTETDFGGRESKIEALGNAIEKAADLVKNPGQKPAINALISATSKMRYEIEGSYLSRRENSLWAALLGALGFLVGFAIYIGSILSAPASTIGGVLGITAGVGLMIYFGRMFVNAVWPEKNSIEGTENEKEHSKNLANAFTGFTSLAKNNAALFNAADKLSADKDKPQTAHQQRKRSYSIS